MTALTLNIPPIAQLSDEQFYQLCLANRDLRFERTAKGELIIMPPTGGETGNRNFKLIQQLANWTDADGTGLGWLINRQNQTVEIYPQEQEVEVVQSPTTLSGEDVLP